jgi:hypothetical protein
MWIDPVQLAVSKSKAADLQTAMAEAQAAKWRTINKEGETKRRLDDIWHEARRQMVAEFRKTFKRRKWRGLSVSFQGEGYSIDWSSQPYHVKGYLAYRVHWHGAEIYHQFGAYSMEDIKSEARRLKRVLEAWDE